MKTTTRLNRRRWLGLSSSVAVLPLSGRGVLAELDPLRFYLVSDTHLGRNDNQAAERNWRKTVEEIAANEHQGRFVLHLGDVVDRGREEQYPIYVRTRRGLGGLPVHEIPGNHDPVDLFRTHVAEETDRSFDEGSVRFVLFNNSRRDSHDGFIEKEQLEWLAAEFASAKEAGLAIVVACHVPIHHNRPPDRAWYVKPDSGQREFYELHQQYADRILACFHGHFHNGIRGWRDRGQTVETLIPSVCYNQNRNLREHLATGKADGFFVDELRPGYVLAEISKTELRLTYKPIGEDPGGQYRAEYPG